MTILCSPEYFSIKILFRGISSIAVKNEINIYSKAVIRKPY